MKKILFVIGSMGHGGAESQLLHLIKSCLKNNFQVSVYLFSRSGELLPELESLNVKIYSGYYSRFKLKGKLVSYANFLLSSIKLLLILIFNRFLLVQSYLPQSNIVSTIAARLTFHKVFIGCRGMTKHYEGKPIYKILDEYSNKFSTGINTNAKAILEDKASKERFFSYEKCTVINNYFPFKDINLLDDDEINYEREKLGFSNDDIVMLYVANLIDYKGHFDLINALYELPCNYKLILCGRDDGIYEELNKKMISLNIKNSIKYLKYCNKNQLNLYYQIADMYVCPSHTEGLSNSLLQALAYEKKIVSTPSGGNRELLENGVLGIIAEAHNPNDFMKKIIQSTNKERVLFNRDYIKRKYSNDAMFNGYLKSWGIEK